MLALVVVLGGVWVVRVVRGSTPLNLLGGGCVVRGAGGSSTLDPGQARNAALIAAVGMSRGLPERAVVVALATALQESKLRNLDYGHADSLGLFQQRPSQGWGTAAQVRDPEYASRAFYRALVAVPGWIRLPVTVAAQRVQRSAYPDAYADHEPAATRLAAALTGRTPAALTCPAESAVSGSAATVRARLVAAFPAGGAGPGVRVTAVRVPARPTVGAGTPAADPAGLRWTVRVTPSTTAGAAGGRGQAEWAVAAWLVANAGPGDVTRVVVGERVWSAVGSGTWSRAAPTPPNARPTPGGGGGVAVTVTH